jgi:protein O-mannosyl-transferase
MAATRNMATASKSNAATRGADDLPVSNSAGEPSALGRFAPWIIVVLIAVTFGRVIGQGITPADDRSTIFQNPRMNRADHAPSLTGDDGLGWYWKHGDLALYIPVAFTIWFLLAKATWVPTPDENGMHLDPRIFHGVSLLLHIANSLLVYWLLLKLLRIRRNRSHWPALAGALLYGLHPLQVEAVAWISGMKDLLYCGFGLGALLSYVRAIEPPRAIGGDARWIRWISYFGGILLMLLGMLCKPTAMVVPVLALALDWLIVKRGPAKAILSVLPYIVAAIPLMIVAKIVQPGIGVPTPPLWERPIVAGASLAFYLDKLALPRRMCFDYGWLPVEMLHKAWFWWIAMIPMIVLLVSISLWRWRPWLMVGFLIMTVALLPVLGLVPFHYQFFSTVADHYMVLAMLGPAIAVAGLLSCTRGSWQIPTIGIAAICLLGLAGRSFMQLGHWGTELDVLHQMVAVNPRSALGHNGLGGFYRSSGQWQKAAAEFKATQANPLYFNGTVNLARLYASVGEPRQAIAAFHQLLLIANRLPAQVRPNFYDMPNELAVIAAQSGHKLDVPLYFLEHAHLWFARHYESWLGGPVMKYLPPRP